ncbi:MAG TPA: PAS domain S-box protein, partial [Solirubrobacteraceae bacterium]
MIDAPLPIDEGRRLAAVRALGLLDTLPEERFDRITRTAAAAFGVPIATVTLVDANRQWFKSCVGLAGRQSPRATSFCAHALLDENTLVIPDAMDDARFIDNPLVVGPPHIRFYAGHPLRAPDGSRVGTLCIIDRRPRELDAGGRQLLRDLAGWAEEELGRRALSDVVGQMYRSETSLRAVMDGVAEGIVTFDGGGRILSANPAAEAAFRVDPGGLVGHSITSLLVDVDWTQVAAGLGAAGPRGAGPVIGERRELIGRRADGATFPLELVVTEAEVDGARAFVAIGQDVSERRRTEALLRESERRFRAIFHRAGMGIALIDLDGVMVDANPALVDMLGYSAVELRELDRDIFNHPDDAAQDGPLLESLRSKRTDRYRREKRYIRRDGTELWAALTVTAIPEPGGPPRFAIAMIEDITRRKEVERLKDEFVSVVGHELRTPLTSIRGSLGLVAAGVTGELPGEAARMVEVAMANSDRLVRLINDMLDMERMDSGRAELDLGPAAATTLIDAALEVVQPMADEAGVTIARGPASDVTVWADADRIVQALTNLLSNAVKFSPPGGEVAVDVRAERRDAVFTVCDEGRGIPPNQLETIFERFRQVDASDGREKGGTGLGLAISRSIVEQHGGRIWVESGLGEGTTFHFTLHLVGDGDQAGGDAVLVVEDDAGLGEILVEVLRAGETRVVRTAEEAVAALDESDPGVIVLDVALPGDSGLSVVDHLREREMAATP